MPTISQKRFTSAHMGLAWTSARSWPFEHANDQPKRLLFEGHVGEGFSAPCSCRSRSP